jgi:hypothetical protein
LNENIFEIRELSITPNRAYRSFIEENVPSGCSVLITKFTDHQMKLQKIYKEPPAKDYI